MENEQQTNETNEPAEITEHKESDSNTVVTETESENTEVRKSTEPVHNENVFEENLPTENENENNILIEPEPEPKPKSKPEPEPKTETKKDNTNEVLIWVLVGLVVSVALYYVAKMNKENENKETI